MRSSTNPQDVTLAGCEANVVAADVPRPVGVVIGDQVVHAVRGWQSGRGRKDAYALLARERVEVDDDDHHVVAGPLEIGEEAVVLRLEEREVVEVLERRVVATRTVERGNERQ